MKWNAYLFFEGKCEAAFKYYQGILGGEIPIMMKNGESPAASHTAPDKMDDILHARLVVGDNVLMGSDSPFPGGEPAKCYAVSVIEESITEAERIFKAFADDGEVRMPFEKTFFAERFGMVVDKFGILWMINAGETM
jgi:PhnB protein